MNQSYLSQEILIVLQKGETCFYLELNKKVINQKQAQDYIEENNICDHLEDYNHCNISSEMNVLIKQTRQQLQKLYKIAQFHEEFIKQIDQYCKQDTKINKSNTLVDVYTDNSENILKKYCYKSQAFDIIQNFEIFQIKIANKQEDFILSLYNPYKIDINKSKQFFIQKLSLDVIYYDNDTPFIRCKQLQQIQTLFNQFCQTTISMAELTVHLLFQEINESQEDYQGNEINKADRNEKHIQLLDLTYLNPQQLNLNFINIDLDTYLQSNKLKIQLCLPDQYLKLTIQKNLSTFEWICNTNIFDDPIRFLDKNRKKLQASFVPNYYNNDFLIIVSPPRFSEFAIDRILLEGQITLLLHIFNKYNYWDILYNSFYVILYDLYLDD